RERHEGHCRHSGVYSGMTWSPLFTLVTPLPTSTTPAPSWPRIAGNRPSGSAPERVNSSVWQTPVALISTITSPSRGPPRWTVEISSGLPADVATAARTSMAIPLCLRPLCDNGLAAFPRWVLPHSTGLGTSARHMTDDFDKFAARAAPAIFVVLWSTGFV